MNRFLSFLAGLFTGTIVGAIVAILFAPTAGADLQGEIRQRAITLRDEVAKAAEERRAELESQLAHLRNS